MMDEAKLDRVSKIVTAYLEHHEVAPDELPILIRDIDIALTKVITGGHVQQVAKLAPANPEPVQVEEVREAPIAPKFEAKHEARLVPKHDPDKSVHPDYIVCLEDGQRYKTLRRHLRTAYGMSPEDYREKWGLPDDYPMVAPNYAKARAKIAQRIGLGTLRVKEKVEEQARNNFRRRKVA